MEGFWREWQSSLPKIKGKKLVSVYFGGGTPTLLGPERIGQILDWIRDVFPEPIEEITLEANPEGVTAESMNAFCSIGINRVSLGLQTLDDVLLKELGRTHSANQSLEAAQTVWESGIKNITVDLLYDIPYQTLDSWQRTLDRLSSLPIAHLSLYNLTFEPETIFFKKRALLQPAVPDPDVSAQMYTSAVKTLEKMGLKQYEISAFAKEGFHSRHNVGYWTARPFLGLGPSAFSYWEGERFRNVAHLRRYCQALEAGHSPIDFTEKLDPIARRRELLAVQLRLMTGVDLHHFEILHGPLDPVTVNVLSDLEKKGFLERCYSQVKLTVHGRLFYDSVAVEII